MNNIKQFIKYISWFVGIIFTLLLLFVGYLYLWLSDNQEKKIHYLDSSLQYSNDYVLDWSNTNIQYAKDRNIIFRGSINIKNTKNKETLLSVKGIFLRLNVSRFFYDLSIPIDVKIEDFKLNLNNAASDLNFIPAAKDKTNNKKFELGIFKWLKQTSKLLNRNSFLYLNNIEVKNAVIIREDLTYKIEEHSSYNNNIYNITLKITHSNQVSIIKLISTNENKKSSLSLQLIDFPLWICSKLVPIQYNMPVLYEANRHLLIQGNLNYILSKENPVGDLSININSQDSSNSNLLKNFILSLKSEGEKELFLKKFHIALNENKGVVDMSGSITHHKGELLKDSSAKLKIKSNNIDLIYVPMLWPYGVNKVTRTWLITAIKRGYVDDLDATLNIEKLSHIEPEDFLLSFSFKDLDLKYSNNFETITNIRGKAKLNYHEAIITFKEADIIESKIYDSSIEINYKEKSIPLLIKVNAEGRVKDFVHLMGEKNIKKFNERKVKIQETGGRTKAKILVEIPLAKEFKQENINIDVLGHIDDLDISFADFLYIKQGDVDIKIKDKVVSLIGRILINDQPSRLEWMSHLEGHEYFDNRLVINSYIGPNTQFEELFAGKLKIKEGEMLTNFMYMNKDSIEKIILQLNLDDTRFTIPDIGLEKDKGDAFFNFEMTKNGDSNWKTNKFQLTAEDVDIKSSLELTPELSLVSFNSHIQYAETLVNLSILSDNEKLDIKLQGPRVKFDKANLLHLSNVGVYQQFMKGKKQNQDIPDKKYLVSMQIDKAIMKNGVTFENIIGNFECYKRICKNSGLSMNIDKKDKLKISLQNYKNRDTWTFSATNASRFLKAFDVYRDIEGGTCSAKLHTVRQSYITSTPGSILSGHLRIDDFHAVKTPIIADLLLSSPFKALVAASKKQNLMHFNTLSTHFVFSFLNHKLSINRAYAKGDLLSITGKGYVDIANEKININGVLIPSFRVNQIVSSFSNEESPEGMIVTEYSIKGNTKAPEVSVNPIEVLVSVLLNLPGFGLVL